MHVPSKRTGSLVSSTRLIPAKASNLSSSLLGLLINSTFVGQSGSPILTASSSGSDMVIGVHCYGGIADRASNYGPAFMEPANNLPIFLKALQTVTTGIVGDGIDVQAIRTEQEGIYDLCEMTIPVSLP